MKTLFSLVGLLLVLALVGLLAKSQLGITSKPVTAPSETSGVSLPATTPGASAARQSQEIQLQIKQSVEAVMQSPRAMPNEK